MASSTPSLTTPYKTLEIVPSPQHPSLFYLYLNTPKSLNAMTPPFFSELPAAIHFLDQHPSVRAIILSARGSHFCSGIHLSSLQSITGSQSPSADRAAAGEALRRSILGLQDAVTAVERCRKPVVAEISGACVGGGVDLVTACDMRWCDESAWFSVKEVDLGLAADLGTLQRLPRIVGWGNAVEMALTGRRVGAAEAKGMGLVTKVFEGRKELEEGVAKLGVELAEKSANAVMGTKAVMLRSRDLTVEQGLEYVATWNSSMLMSRDLEEAVQAQIQKRKPVFNKSNL